MKVSYLLAAVAILGLAGFAMAARSEKGDKGKAPKGLNGKITAVDAVAKTVTVKAKGKEIVVNASTATVTIDGVEGKAVGDLAAGMVVTVTPETGPATKIVAKTPPAAPKKEGKKGKGGAE